MTRRRNETTSNRTRLGKPAELDQRPAAVGIIPRGQLSRPGLQTETDCELFTNQVLDSRSFRKFSAYYTTELEASDNTGVRLILHRYLEDADTARHNVEKRGKFRQFSEQTLKFLSTFHSYLEAYGGILELMRAAGGDYGEAVYKALAILLIIAVNKQERDEKITEVLESLRRQFAQFKIIEDVHPTAEMHDLVEKAYLIGIEFAQYAIRYYLRGSLGRLWSVIKDPPNTFEDQLTKLASSVEEVKAEREVLDNQRLHIVSQDLAELRRTIDEHESRYAEMQTQLRDDWREKLVQKIRPSEYQRGALARYQFRLDAQFNGDRQDSSPRLEELRQSAPFRGWYCETKSSILLLRGEARGITHFSWFSPVVLRLYNDLKRREESAAFHCCQGFDSNDRGDRFTLVLRYLMVSLLGTTIVNLDAAALESFYKKSEQMQEDEDVRTAMTLLSDICFALGRVTLIIDRADLMRGDWEENLSRLCSLIRLQDDAGSVVKMILIGSCSTTDWGGLKESMTHQVGRGRVFELRCAESDWNDVKSP